MISNISDLESQKSQKFSLKFFSKFLQTKALSIGWFMFRRYCWVELDVDSEKIVAYWARFKVWSIHGSWRLSWFRASLSFNFIIIHFTKHIGIVLEHHKPWSKLNTVLFIKKVSFRALSFQNPWPYYCRSKHADEIKLWIEWNDVISMKLCSIEVFMLIFLFFDLAWICCFLHESLLDLWCMWNEASNAMLILYFWTFFVIYGKSRWRSSSSLHELILFPD
jgi:hypothetical protein